MKKHCRSCGGLIKPGLLWGMIRCLYCKVCKRIVDWSMKDE